jgi:hypothetical protein
MSKRSEEWMDEFGDLLEGVDDETKALVLDGSIEICPACHEMSAHSWNDANGYEEFTDGITPGGFKPEKGKIAHIGTASCFEWECGHCGAHCVKRDSPINHPAYTHRDEEEDD